MSPVKCHLFHILLFFLTISAGLSCWYLAFFFLLLYIPHATTAVHLYTSDYIGLQDQELICTKFRDPETGVHVRCADIVQRGEGRGRRAGGGGGGVGVKGRNQGSVLNDASKLLATAVQLEIKFPPSSLLAAASIVLPWLQNFHFSASTLTFDIVIIGSGERERKKRRSWFASGESPQLWLRFTRWVSIRLCRMHFWFGANF